MIRTLASATCALVNRVIGTSAHGAQVVTYPAPQGQRPERPDQVWAGDQEVDVDAARTPDPPFADKQRDFRGPYSFASFDMSERVVVTITSSRSLRNTVVRPLSARIKPILRDDHSLTITLESPSKLSLEPDGKKGPLLLFANPLETDIPQPDEPNVVYYGPGVHKPERIELGSNQTLYLAGGSVVTAGLLVRGTNVRIRGRGILDGSDWAWRTGPIGNPIAIRDSQNVEISGVTLRGSSHSSIVPVDSQNGTDNVSDVTFRNVQILDTDRTKESPHVRIGAHVDTVQFSSDDEDRK